jgi:hypothetical protein
MGIITAFFKQNPIVDTPYRQLMLSQKGGWKVRLLGGTKWGPKQCREIKVVQAKSFDEAKKAYDKAFGELVDEGWRPYSPFVPW